jgi:hypothetical protein
MRFDPPNSDNDLYEQALAFTPLGRWKEAIPAPTRRSSIENLRTRANTHRTRDPRPGAIQLTTWLFAESDNWPRPPDG